MTGPGALDGTGKVGRSGAFAGAGADKGIWRGGSTHGRAPCPRASAEFTTSPRKGNIPSHRNLLACILLSSRSAGETPLPQWRSRHEELGAAHRGEVPVRRPVLQRFLEEFGAAARAPAASMRMNRDRNTAELRTR